MLGELVMIDQHFPIEFGLQSGLSRESISQAMSTLRVLRYKEMWRERVNN